LGFLCVNVKKCDLHLFKRAKQSLFEAIQTVIALNKNLLLVAQIHFSHFVLLRSTTYSVLMAKVAVLRSLLLRQQGRVFRADQLSGAFLSLILFEFLEKMPYQTCFKTHQIHASFQTLSRLGPPQTIF